MIMEDFYDYATDYAGQIKALRYDGSEELLDVLLYVPGFHAQRGVLYWNDKVVNEGDYVVTKLGEFAVMTNIEFHLKEI